MNQLVTELPAADGHGARMQISVAQNVEQGARAMLISIPDVMRLDVAPSDDMVRMIVRSFRAPALAFAPTPESGSEAIRLHGSGDLSLAPVGNFTARIAIGDRTGPELARVQIGSIRHPDRGIVAFTAQAIVDADLLGSAFSAAG